MKSAMAKHILVKTKAQAESIKQQLKQGEDFAKLGSIPPALQKNAMVIWERFTPVNWSSPLSRLFLKKVFLKFMTRSKAALAITLSSFILEANLHYA